MTTTSTRIGRVNYNGTYPTLQEVYAITALCRHGHDVTLIPVAGKPHVKSPDVRLEDHRPWEIKTINVLSPHTLHHTIVYAVGQAPNLIFDVRPLPDHQRERALEIITRHYHAIKKVRRLKVIIADDTILEWEKQPTQHTKSR